MSRGPGRVERAVASVFTERPTDTFSTSELLAIVYPLVAVPQKTHTVALLRAAKRVAQRMWWGSTRQWHVQGQMIFFNRLDLHSTAIANLRIHNWRNESAAELEDELVPGGKYSDKVMPNGEWWNNVERAKAEAAGDTERVKHFTAKADAEFNALFSDSSFDHTLYMVQLEAAIKQGREEVAAVLTASNDNDTQQSKAA